MKIDMERHNKSTMPVNAEKYFMTHRGIRTHDVGRPRWSARLPGKQDLTNSFRRSPEQDCLVSRILDLVNIKFENIVR